MILINGGKHLVLNKGVALTEHNHTGPPCSVDHPAGLPSGSFTDYDRCQRAKQYWPVRQATNE